MVDTNQKMVKSVFEVNFSEIDRNLFKEKRENKYQEWTRELILAAFDMADEYPKKYGKSFKTLIPMKNWDSITVSECLELANNIGGYIADWVEQALEWAQLIASGETWDEVCNKPGAINCPRVIDWDGSLKSVYSPRNIYEFYAMDPDRSPFRRLGYCYYSEFLKEVPLIVKGNKRPTKPTEGIPFKVNVSKIDRELFKKKRADEMEEKTRQRILNAFEKVDENPKMYGESFQTLIPMKNWEDITVGQCIELANDLGGHIANNVEQALEWAQRLSNGETWEDLCYKIDFSHWYRVIELENGAFTQVGGCREIDDYESSITTIKNVYDNYSSTIHWSVPLIVKGNKRPMKPTEGIPFEINVSEIDRELFKMKRVDEKQEIIRQHILDAFAKVDKYPQKYGKSFKTLMPELYQQFLTYNEVIEIANSFGGHIADFTEQALEWAQRIFNGENWEDLCNKPDTANWPRIIKEDNGLIYIVGGARDENEIYCRTRDRIIPASEIRYFGFTLAKYSANVPLIVIQ